MIYFDAIKIEKKTEFRKNSVIHYSLLLKIPLAKILYSYYFGSRYFLEADCVRHVLGIIKFSYGWDQAEQVGEM